MFIITFEVTPDTTHPQKDGIGGAYVNCWIKRTSLDEAIADAQALIAEQGFIVDEPDEISEVSRKDYDDGSLEQKCYDGAMIAGHSLVFHTFPVVDETD